MCQDRMRHIRRSQIIEMEALLGIRICGEGHKEVQEY